MEVLQTFLGSFAGICPIILLQFHEVSWNFAGVLLELARFGGGLHDLLEFHGGFTMFLGVL